MTEARPEGGVGVLPQWTQRKRRLNYVEEVHSANMSVCCVYVNVYE